MALSIKRLVPGSILTGSAATYYTCPSSKYAILKSVTLANTTAGAVSASLHLVPSGDSASAANMIRPPRLIDANESYTCPEAVNQVLEGGGTIQALGAGLTLIVSGAEGVNA